MGFQTTFEKQFGLGALPADAINYVQGVTPPRQQKAGSPGAGASGNPEKSAPEFTAKRQAA